MTPVLSPSLSIFSPVDDTVASLPATRLTIDVLTPIAELPTEPGLAMVWDAESDEPVIVPVQSFSIIQDFMVCARLRAFETDGSDRFLVEGAGGQKVWVMASELVSVGEVVSCPR